MGMIILPILQTTIKSSLTTYDYSCMNDLMGQMAAILTLDSRITISSDNNPASSVARVIIFDFAGSTHKIKFYPYSSYKTYMNIGILAVDLTTILMSSFYTFVSGTPIPVTFLYSDHITAFVATKIAFLCAINSGDPRGWHISVPTNDANGVFSPGTYINYLRFYSPDSDTRQQLVLPCCGYLKADNGIILLPSVLVDETGTKASSYQDQRQVIRGGLLPAVLPAGDYVSGGKLYLAYNCYGASNFILCEG